MDYSRCWRGLCIVFLFAIAGLATEPQIAQGRVVRVKGRIFDKEGNKARIEAATFIAGRATVKVIRQTLGDGTFDYELEIRQERPLLFKFVGRTAPGLGQAGDKDLHWAMVSYLATRDDAAMTGESNAPLEYTIDLVMFDKEGPEDIEPILQQLLVYERLYYIERLRGEKPEAIRAQYAGFVQEIPSPDGLRRELFTPSKLAAQGMNPAVVSFALETLKRKRQEVLALYGLAAPDKGRCAQVACKRYPSHTRHFCRRRR